MLSFVVAGDPVPQGSMVALKSRNPRDRRVFVKPSNEKELKAWREKVARAVTLAAGGRLIGDNVPITVRATFRLQPPVHMPKGRIAATVAPDADKLLRAVLDGMTVNEYGAVGKLGLYADDKQVIDAHVVKAYATAAHPAGAYIEVEYSEALL